MFPLRRTLETEIIESLQKGPLSTRDLLESLRTRHRSTTKQGMYVALRKLIRAEIVLKQKQQVSLNVTWLTRMESFVTVAGHFYAKDAQGGSFLSLADGEKITYRFRDSNATDAFWIHILLLLVEAYPGTPFVAYDPHCWFLLVRSPSERTLRDAIIQRGGQYFILAGGKQPLDRVIRGEFNGKSSQYYMRESPLYPQNNYYINVIGDYVIEVWIDAAHANAIERVYETESTMSPAAEEQLRYIINSRGRSKLVISRNKRHSQKIFAKLTKPFVVANRSAV